MKSKKNIFLIFKADQGERYGYGHLYRMLSIYNFLKKNTNLKFYFFINNNNDVKSLLRNKKINNIFSIKTKKNFENLDNTICVIDTFLKLGKDIKNFISNNNLKKVIIFDNIEKNNYIKINPVAYLTKKFPNHRNIYQGLKYFITNKSKKSKKSKLYKKILITIGGSDKYNLSYLIAKKIMNDFSLSVLVGPGYNKKNKIFKLKNIKFFRNLKSTSNLFLNNDIVISTGGFSMFESCSLNKPTFVIENYRHQKNAIKYFEKKKYIYNFGSRKKFKQLSSKKTILILKNTKIIKNLIKKNQNIFDSKAISRIKDIILKI